MDNFDLKKYLAEGRLLKEEVNTREIAQALRDEAEQPDSAIGKEIFLKYAEVIENPTVFILRKLEDELISKYPDTFSGDDDIVGSFMSVGREPSL